MKLNHIRSKKGLKRLERKAAREGRLGGHVKAGLKYMNAVTELYDSIVWDEEEVEKSHENPNRLCQQ
jgi:hypothetical protein